MRRILASIVFGLLPIASHCLDAARTTLARRGVLARALAAPAAALAGVVVAPSAAHAGIADQLEAASRASEITYSQNGNLRRPRTTTKPPNHPNVSKCGARGTHETTEIPKNQQRAQTATMGPSYGHRAASCAETRKQPKCTRRGAGVAREPSRTAATPEHKERAQTEATEPSYGGTRDDEA